MLKIATTRTLTLWIACLAFLFSALAPSISHALAAANPIRFEICSAAGGQTAITGGVMLKKSGTDGAQPHMEHCAYCMSHAGTFALPSGVTPGFAVIGGHDLFPPLFYTAPAPLFTWSAAHPRGPPAVS